MQKVKLPHVGSAREVAKLEAGAWLRPTARALEPGAAAAEKVSWLEAWRWAGGRRVYPRKFGSGDGLNNSVA